MPLLTAAFVLASLGHGLPADAASVPLPRPRPPIAAPPPIAAASDHGPPTDCDKRLAPMAVFKPKPTLTGPGACGGPDLVELDMVLLPGGARVAVTPVATLQCGMAESFAAWVRDEVVERLAPLKSPLRAVINEDSYECRGRNRVVGAKVSEHGKGNAIDVRAFVLADGRKFVLTDVNAPKDLRLSLQESACGRFTTVLGPGADPYHGKHIHLDVLARHNGYRICEWAVREPAPPPPPPTVAQIPLPPQRPRLPAIARKL
jgi:hypothetical protein